MIKKNITQKQFLFGDFDKDKVKNVDDAYPYDPKRQYYKKHPTQVRFGNKETKLSDELLTLEKHNKLKAAILRKFLNEQKKKHETYGRVKTVASTIKKLRERYIGNIKDIAGATILTDKRKDTYKIAKKIRQKYKYDRRETNDYYKKPTRMGYRAIHLGLIYPKKQRLELQIKTRAMNNLGKEMHPFYKRGVHSPRLARKSKNLFLQGY